MSQCSKEISKEKNMRSRLSNSKNQGSFHWARKYCFQVYYQWDHSLIWWLRSFIQKFISFSFESMEIWWEMMTASIIYLWVAFISWNFFGLFFLYLFGYFCFFCLLRINFLWVFFWEKWLQYVWTNNLIGFMICYEVKILETCWQVRC